MREMKHSGIEWIGEIPKDWDKGHLKYYTQIKTGGTPSTSNQVWFDGDVLWFTPGDFDNILLNDSKRKLSNLAVLFRVANLFPANTTMIVGIGGTAGKVGYTIKESYCNQQITALINKSNTYPKYITYLMFCFSDVLKDNALYTTLPILNNQFIGNFSICIPKKLSEQRKIADYLDTKCSEIDATAENIQKEISLLEEYKKSVITEAVTKGLNPDAEMKDSGIEWIGEIPKDWKVHPVYVYFEEGKTKNYRMQEQNLLSLSYGRIIRKDINTNGGLLPASFNTYNVVEAGDIIIRPTDLQNDKRSLRTGLVKEQGIITSAYIDLRPKDNVNSKYYHYLLHSYDIIKVFYNMGNGVRQGLNFSEFAKLLLLEPTTVEQLQIADYLDTKCSEIDSLIADKKRQLDILADYKKSLIYEYVTGKKEVPVKDF